MRESQALTRGLKPLARIVGHMTHAQKPAEFSIAPIDAIKKLLAKINWTKNDVDLFAINEAFAVVTMRIGAGLSQSQYSRWCLCTRSPYWLFWCTDIGHADLCA